MPTLITHRLTSTPFVLICVTDADDRLSDLQFFAQGRCRRPQQSANLERFDLATSRGLVGCRPVQAKNCSGLRHGQPWLREQLVDLICRQLLLGVFPCSSSVPGSAPAPNTTGRTQINPSWLDCQENYAKSTQQDEIGRRLKMPRRTVKGSGKKSPLNMRTTQALRKKLEKAAGLSGRSLVQEVEFRLEQSFAREDFGKRQAAHLDVDVAGLRLLRPDRGVHRQELLRRRCQRRCWLQLLSWSLRRLWKRTTTTRPTVLGRAVAEAVAGRRAMGDLFRLPENN